MKMYIEIVQKPVENREIVMETTFWQKKNRKTKKTIKREGKTK